MRFGHAALVLLCAGTQAWSQTQIDLSRQAKSVDFSNASATRPSKTGTVLPATCKTGDAFFKVDALPGSNIYGCTSANVWMQMIGFSGISDSEVSNTSTTVTVAPGVFRSNNIITSVQSVATIQANAGSLASGAQSWIEYDPISQTRILLTNILVNQANLDVTNINLGSPTATGFTSGRIPIAMCQGGFATDQWNSCTDMRTPFAGVKINAGANTQVTTESDGSFTVSNGTVANPVAYAVAGTTASCPASWITLTSKPILAGDPVTSGDHLKVLAAFQRTGSDNIEVEVLFAGAPMTGGATMGSNLYFVESDVLVTSATSIVSSTVVRDVSGEVIATVSSAGSLTIGETPTFQFRARNCASSTIELLKGFITHHHDSNL